MGEMVAHHWALEQSEYRILDPSEMTPWHINFQNILEKKCGYKLEQLRKTPEGFRKADALNKELGVVVEVQYSNIEEKVLYDRTKFWVDLGFTVVWIFNDKKHANFEGKYKNQQRWSRQPVWWRTFQEFRSNVEIIIQSPKLERIIIEDAEGDEDIVETKDILPDRGG